MEKFSKEVNHVDYISAPRRLSAQGRRISVVDDVFGEIKEDGPNYRDVSLSQMRKRGHKLTNFTRSDGSVPLH